MNTYAHARCNTHAENDLSSKEMKKRKLCQTKHNKEFRCVTFYALFCVHTPVIINPTIIKLAYAASSVLLVSPTKEYMYYYENPTKYIGKCAVRI